MPQTEALKALTETDVSRLALDLLPFATKFTFTREGPLSEKTSDLGYANRIEIAWRGDASWAILRRGYVWVRTGKNKRAWEHEPLPSNRTKAFIKRSRWRLDEAIKEVNKILKKDDPECV